MIRPPHLLEANLSHKLLCPPLVLVLFAVTELFEGSLLSSCTPHVKKTH